MTAVRDGLEHGDPELEALLPRTVHGTEMIRFSGRGIQGDREGRVEVQLLEHLGAEDAAYSYAMATPRAQLDLLVQAFRVRDADPEALLEAFLVTFPSSTGPITLGVPFDRPIPQDELTVDGREVVKLHGAASAVYLYAHEDVVFAVWTADEELARRVISGLPG